MTDNESAEDLGAPVAYPVLKVGTTVWDNAGDRVGTVEHVLADEQSDVFHGLIVKVADGHRFAPAGQVDGLFEHGVIVAVPAGQLPDPSTDPTARQAENDGLTAGLKRAWEWLIQPR